MRHMVKAICLDVMNTFVAFNYLLIDVFPSITYPLIIFCKILNLYSHRIMLID